MKKIALYALGAALTLAPATMIAQGPPHHDDHHDYGNHNGWDNGHRDDHHDDHHDFHFSDNDRNGFAQHYRSDYNRYRRPDYRRNNPGFYAGRQYPSNIRFRAVPSGYYRGLQAPPPGYRYGYYNGYVVAYNPATRIIADVLDIAAASLR